MRLDQMRAAILADNDQDREAARAWFSEATDNDKLRVWLTIQRAYPEPEMEIMSRLAQLAFGDLILEEPRGETK